MPTYAFRCEVCGAVDEVLLPISEYVRNPPAFFHCSARMERFINCVPGLAVHNALAGDRIYDGLRASDGSDISTRSKHRRYMKENNLTTIDDFSGTWKREAQERANRLQGVDKGRAQDIANAIEKLSG
jgi:putative FmdB family regulatory protein